MRGVYVQSNEAIDELSIPAMMVEYEMGQRLKQAIVEAQVASMREHSMVHVTFRGVSCALSALRCRCTRG